MAATPTDTLATDDELAARAGRRGPDGRVPRDAEVAFARLYERHARPIIAYLAARARRDDVDDLGQEAWRRVWGGLPGGFRGGNFRAWIFEIARNALFDHNRRRRPEALGDGEPGLADGRSVAPDVVLVERERAEALRRCIQELAADAAAIVRAKLGGEDYEAACSRLGLSAKRAYKLFHTAKRQLKECLERTTG